MADVTFSSTSTAEVEADALVIGVGMRDDSPVALAGSEAVDAALGGRLGVVLDDLGASGKPGSVVRFASLGSLPCPVVLGVGLGDADADLDTEIVRRGAGAAVRALAGRSTVALSLPGPADVVAEGALLGAYTVRPGKGKPPVEHVTVLVGDEPPEREGLRTAAVSQAVSLVRDLVNQPANTLSPPALADRAVAEAQNAGVEVSVLDEAELAEAGFGGILAVGTGSSRPPRLVRLQWRPEGARRTVALVGKGITFDSGGLSLKPPVGMEYMKSDMAGAASVLATICAVARLQVPVAVTAWMAVAENMPSSTAYRPTDVVTMYGGTTVEVLNTDAEGRMVLGDALARAAEEQPDAIVDIATLTGGQVVALGSRTTGLMGNDDALLRAVERAAQRSDEPVWAMPMPPEIRTSLDSPVADLRNVAGNGNRDGHMLVGGIFLREFVPEGMPWVHLDIAGPSWNGGEPYGYTPKGATGVMVRTLLALIEDTAEHEPSAESTAPSAPSAPSADG